MDEQQLREQMCDIGRMLWTRGMVAANDGNLSVRLDDERILCTPTLTSKGFLRPELLAVVDPDGRPLGGSAARPSSEIKMHLRIYADSPETRAVCHAHPLFSTALAVRGLALNNTMLPETIVGLGEVPIARYATPSTDAVPASIAPYIRGHRACLLENHGALTWASDQVAAYLLMERVEYTAHLMWVLEVSGGARSLPVDEISKLHSLFSSATTRKGHDEEDH